VYVDPVKDYEINYYDSYGEPPPPKMHRYLKKIGEASDSDKMLKFKWNLVKQQKASTVNCGPFSMRFLTERFAGLPFKDASSYTIEKSHEGEKGIEKWKKKINFDEFF
ncbi:MAG: hypothetical protein R3361_06725, partial [Aequorivita vladivostokensis]|nr:hypothetical protein [Aequorivita vladivostokensis]